MNRLQVYESMRQRERKIILEVCFHGQKKGLVTKCHTGTDIMVDRLFWRKRNNLKPYQNRPLYKKINSSTCKICDTRNARTSTDVANLDIKSHFRIIHTTPS